MSLDKAIQHGKEKRKEYRGSARFDCTCRNHGSCSYCRNNRTIRDTRNSERANLKEQANEFVDMLIGAGDPEDALTTHDEKLLKEHGIDPWDFETRRELDV